MPYKTYNEQILEHLNHLQANGFDITELKIDPPGWVRCHQIGETKGRGELAYITTTKLLNNGLLGVKTSYRGSNGAGSYRTYGHGPDGKNCVISLLNQKHEVPSKNTDILHEEAACKSYGFWKRSSTQGTSDYLKHRGVLLRH
jgi:hypothetical protein